MDEGNVIVNLTLDPARVAEMERIISGFEARWAAMEAKSIPSIVLPPLAEVHGIRVDTQVSKMYWIDKDGMEHAVVCHWAIKARDATTEAAIETCCETPSSKPVKAVREIGVPAVVDVTEYALGVIEQDREKAVYAQLQLVRDAYPIIGVIKEGLHWEVRTYPVGWTHGADYTCVGWGTSRDCAIQNAADIIAANRLGKKRMEIARRREEHVCKVCGNMPDINGHREHGKGCYMVDSDGGGSDFCDLETSAKP